MCECRCLKISGNGFPECELQTANFFGDKASLVKLLKFQQPLVRSTMDQAAELFAAGGGANSRICASAVARAKLANKSGSPSRGVSATSFVSSAVLIKTLFRDVHQSQRDGVALSPMRYHRWVFGRESVLHSPTHRGKLALGDLSKL
jgi:hypothetical protein